MAGADARDSVERAWSLLTCGRQSERNSEGAQVSTYHPQWRGRSALPYRPTVKALPPLAMHWRLAGCGSTFGLRVAEQPGKGYIAGNRLKEPTTARVLHQRSEQ